MSRNNTKNSHIVKAKISSITTNSNNNTFEFEIKHPKKISVPVL